MALLIIQILLSITTRLFQLNSVSCSPEANSALPTDTFIIPGDIHIGSLIYLHDRFSHSRCGSTVSNVYGIQMHMAEVYAIEKINADPSILGNITLGYVAKEECFIGYMSVGQALDFLGVSETSGKNASRVPAEGVVGITGPIGTTSSIAVAGLLTLYHIPQISQGATNDILSDTDIYPYFFRTVPPDSFQTRVMVDFLTYANWTYISVVHDDDTYGYNAIKNIRSQSRTRGICIADSYAIDDSTGYDGFESLARTLLKNARFRSHVVILYIPPSRAEELIRAVGEKSKLSDTKIIFLASADTNRISTFSGAFEQAVGSLVLTWSQQTDRNLQDYMGSIKPTDYPSNTFLRKTWDDLQGCGKAADAAKCYDTAMKDLDYFFPVADTVQAATGILAFAYAIDNLVHERCPKALSDPSLAKACVTPPIVAEYLKTVKIPTPKGILQFDERGEIISEYMIQQLQYVNTTFQLVNIALWKETTASIYKVDSFQWDMGHDPNSTHYEIPESLCAKPCGRGEMYIQGELLCCWECHRCRNNEYLTKNGTTCTVCPYLTWPDKETIETCLRIHEAYLSWSDIYGIGLLVLCLAGLVVTIIMFYQVIKYRSAKVIKGTVPDMVLLILSGILMAFGSVPLYIYPASNVLCLMRCVCFTVSCTLIYGPVFVKTQLIYNVFAAAEKFKRSTKMATSHGKISLTLTSFIIQAGLLAASLVIWPVRAIYAMPVRTEQYVELYCSQDQQGFLLPLSYNILLTLLCSIFGFLTRKLPDNFNESWYIFISVSTTLFIWIAFLPTYFAAFYAYHKAALLAFALILNGFVSIVCLFAPKVYALHYVDEKDIKISDFNDQANRMSVSTEKAATPADMPASDPTCA